MLHEWADGPIDRLISWLTEQWEVRWGDRGSESKVGELGGLVGKLGRALGYVDRWMDRPMDRMRGLGVNTGWMRE